MCDIGKGRSTGGNDGSGARTSSVLPDLLSQAGQPTTPPRHDKSTSEEVRIPPHMPHKLYSRYAFY